MPFLKKLLPIFIIICLSYFTIRPLFISGFFPIHDDTQVQRVFEMKKSLADGMLPVRWVGDLGYGYGYPIFNFYAPSAYYIGGFLNLIGFDALIATKIMLGLAVVLSGITMYLLAKEFWGRIGGMISGVLYLFAPYHAVNIFVRGDFAELWAYTFIPLVFLGIYKISRRKKSWFWITVSALSFAAIIVSHNLTAMMITPFIIMYALILIISSSKNNRLRLTSYVLRLFILGLLLPAFYWLPALSEMKYTNVISQIGGGADFKDHFVCLPQLWESPWGFGGSSSGCSNDGLSFRIGKIHLVLASLSLIVLFLIFNRLDKQKIKIQLIFFIILFLTSVYFMLEISRPLWDAVPQMAYFQYPWRFLIIASFATSFLGGSIIVLLKLMTKNSRYQKIISVCFAVVVISGSIFINSKLFAPQYISNAKSSDFTSELNLKWKTSKISDEYLPENFAKPRRENEIPSSKFTAQNNTTKITMLEDRVQQFSAEITSDQNSIIHINLAYFPAWHIFLDNSEISYQVISKGLRVTVPKGEHKLSAKFIQTPIQKLGNVLTITGVIALFIGIITHVLTKYAKKTT